MKKIKILSFFICIMLVFLTSAKVYAWKPTAPGSNQKLIYTKENNGLILDNLSIDLYLDSFYDETNDLRHDGKQVTTYSFYNPTDSDVTNRYYLPLDERIQDLYYYYDIEKCISITSSDSKQLGCLRGVYTGSNAYTIDYYLSNITNEYRTDVIDNEKTYIKYDITFSSKSINDAARIDINYSFENKDDIVYSYIAKTYDNKYYVSSYINNNDSVSMYFKNDTVFNDFMANCLCGYDKTSLNDIEITYIKGDVMTLKDIIISYNKGYGLNDMDYFNAYCSMISNYSSDVAVQCGHDLYSLFLCYEFDITVPAKSKYTFTTTTPIFPTEDYQTKPDTYIYNIDLSYLNNYNYDKNVAINVYSDLYVINSSNNYSQNNKCYTYDITSNYPDTFSISTCESKHPRPSTSAIIWSIFAGVTYVIMFAPIIAAIVIIILAVIRVNKKRNELKNIDDKDEKIIKKKNNVYNIISLIEALVALLNIVVIFVCYISDLYLSNYIIIATISYTLIFEVVKMIYKKKFDYLFLLFFLPLGLYFFNNVNEIFIIISAITAFIVFVASIINTYRNI